MALKDKLVIEISAEQMHKSEYHYADLILPATDGQIEDAMQMLMRIAKSRNCLSKGNELDYSKAAALLIEDFRSGKLGNLTLELPKEM